MSTTVTLKQEAIELKNTIEQSIEKMFPIESGNKILEVSDVYTDYTGIESDNFASQKEVKVHGKDYVAPVFARVVLKDKDTGEILDERKKFKIMDTPVLTDRRTFIFGGNEYTVDKQLRMKPGIYTREKENGELESQFNLARGGGRGFKLWMNPENGVFKLKIGTSNPSLYPILSSMGIKDNEMKQMWGEQLFELNKSKSDRAFDADIKRTYKAIFQKDAPGVEAAKLEIKEYFDNTILSPETTKRTLGKGFDKVEADTLLRTSKKLLDVSRGDVEADDRDALIFKHIYSTADLIQARMDANVNRIRRDAQRSMNRTSKISEIISKEHISKPVRQFFTQGSVAHLSDQENPAAMFAEMTKVTSLGEGAIGDMNSITESMRNVNTSHAGVLDPVATPESEKIGINLHLALGAVIKDKELHTVVKNRKTGKTEVVATKDLFDKNVAFPDQFTKDGKAKRKEATIMSEGKVREISAKDVDYVLADPKQMFSYLSNMVPFAANLQGNRAFMANKMLTQAVPLKYREEPLIQTKAGDGGTFENFAGKVFTPKANTSGEVVSITDDFIEIKDSSGKIHKSYIYNNFPLNNQSHVHSKAIVAVGDKVAENQVIADTSYTKNGTLAIGTNLRVGILPFRGSTFEDGYTVSESAAKKLTSEHIREYNIELGKEDKLNAKAYRAHFPTALTANMQGKLDAEGIVRIGTQVEPGDVLIAHLQKAEASEEDARLGKLSRRLIKGYTNNAQVWDKDVVGEVVDVVKTRTGVKVFVRSEEPSQIGDKIVNRHGAKGIISNILPDNEMPKNKDGEILDLAISPSAIPGRINPSQVLELAASKVAIKKGKPLKIDNFADYNSVKEIKGLLKENGLEDKEELIDPINGQSLGKVAVGNQYFLKLKHQVSKKINARGVGPGYDIDEQPTKGGNSSARAMDRLSFNSLVAHGARENLYEMTALKSQKNPELWRNIQLGLPLPAPKTPFVYDKLLGYLAAGGVNVEKDGSRMYMLPMTDKEILERSNGEIEEAKVVVSKNLRPIKDGLFDEVKTGGLAGNRWTHIKLSEPIVNPVMEKALLSVLDLKQDTFNNLVKGSLYYDEATGELTEDNTGVTAGNAIKSMLSKVDVNKELSSLKESSKKLKGQGLDKANKKMRFLRALQTNGLDPVEAYMINNVPVLPPQFRPVYPMPNGALNTAPINFLYRDMVMVNSQLKEMGEFDDYLKEDLRADLYKAVKAVQGLGDPLVGRGEKRIVGAIELIKGQQPKTGFFQSVVFSKNQDLSGSSTITPSVDMNPDEIKLPKDMAWNLYQPFIVKELVGMGHKPLDAHVMVRDKDPRANLALDRAVKDRPIWLNRAPSLHKFSVMAFQPKLYEGKSIGIHPLVVGGFNADIDGNCTDYNSEIKVRLTKSAVNIFDSLVYTECNTKHKEEFMRTVYESTLSFKTSDSILVNTKIGDFPRIGMPIKDKNGADVYQVPEGVEVVGCDPVTGEAKYYPVTMLTVEQDCPTVRIYFGSREIILSDNESMAVFNHKTGEVAKVAPKDVGKGLIPVIKKDPTPFGAYGDRELGWMLGSFIADGWSTDRAIGYAKNEDAMREEFIRIVRSLHENFTYREYEGAPEDGKLGNSMKVHLNSASLVKFMSKYKCVVNSEGNNPGRTALRKMIPGWILNDGSEEMLWGMFSGLIDGDGSMSINMSTGKPRFTSKYCTSSPYLRDDLQKLCYRLGIRCSVTTVPPRGFSNEAYVINFSTVDMYKYLDKLKCIGERERNILSQWKDNPPAKDDRDVIPLSEEEVRVLKLIVNSRADASLHSVLSRTRKIGFRVNRMMLERHMDAIKEELPNVVARVLAEDTVWETVTKIEDAGVREVFDLAVEEAKVFAINNGIVIWDTMGVYVPVSNKAIEEAKQFMPTKVLEHGADGKVMVSPSHDIMTGLYYLTKKGKDLSSKYSFNSVDDALKLYKDRTININDTVTIEGVKTSIGNRLIRDAVPHNIPLPEKGLSRSTIKGFLKDLSNESSEVFRDTMAKLTKLSAQYNIYSEISIGLDDLEPDYKERDKVIAETQSLLSKAKSDDDRRKVIVNQLPKFTNTVKDYMAEHQDSALTQLMEANGKPSFDQFKQLISTPFAVSDVSGKAFPFITTKSFAEGLPVSEYWTTTYGSRAGMIQKRMETAEPGYFSKQVLSVTIDNVVSQDDCGSKDGVVTNLDNLNDVIGRYEAGTNRLIDGDAATSLLKSGKKQVKLRSPLTCLAKEGTCAMCFGLRENGQKAAIGDNIGALAGQYFTEPTTQGAMRAFHTGAVLGAGASMSGGLDRLQQLTLVPEYLKDKATLSKVSGTVQAIDANPAGGKVIVIDGVKHYTGARNIVNDSVRVGATISKGTSLTDGPIKPQELVALKGIRPTQEYLVDSMKETFKGMGVEMNRKLIETVVRSTTNMTTIKDPGNHPFYLPGEQVPLSEITAWNSNSTGDLDIDMAEGATLASSAGPFAAGQKVTKQMIKDLKVLNIDTVKIVSTPIKHTPSITGINSLARMGKDWIAKLNTNYIMQGIEHGVQTGDVSFTHSYNPTAPYVQAISFGRGADGKY